jgi:hypothetical protein
VIAVALGALAVRLFIIAHSHGGNDLRIYMYFSRLALHGQNPFAAAPGGPFPPTQSDSPALEVAVFTGLLAIHDAGTTLRLVFALSDVVVVLLIGLCFPRPRHWRAALMLFYAFNPFVLFAWTVFAEDKSLLFLGIVVLLLALEQGHERRAWTAAGALTAFKFLGAFAVSVLTVHSYRTRRWGSLAPLAGLTSALLLSSVVLWFPRSLEVFSRRDARLAINPPIHASPTLVLARLGVYAPIEAKLLTGTAMVLVLGLFLTRRIDVRAGVVWSLMAGYAFLPDDAFNRQLLISLPFLLIVELSLRRWLALWIVSSWRRSPGW